MRLEIQRYSPALFRWRYSASASPCCSTRASAAWTSGTSSGWIRSRAPAAPWARSSSAENPEIRCAAGLT